MEREQKCIRLVADEAQIAHGRHLLAENGERLRSLSGVLALAGNEVRLKTLFLLHKEGELCPCDLADMLGMSVPAVSQHLRKLRDGTLLQTRREGQTIYYSIRAEQLDLLEPLFERIANERKNPYL